MPTTRHRVARSVALLALAACALPLAASAEDFVYRYKMAGGGAVADGLEGKGAPPADLVTVRFPSFVGNAPTGRVSDVTFTQGTRTVKPIYVKPSEGTQPNAQALVDGDPTTVWTGGTATTTTVGFAPGDSPDGARLAIPGPDGPDGATFKPSGDGGSTFGEGMFSPMLGPWGDDGGEEALPTKPSQPGGSGVNLPRSKGWRKVCGPTAPASIYDKGLGHFTKYRLDRPDFCGLAGQALSSSSDSKEEALSAIGSGRNGYIVAARRYLLPNRPDLLRWQLLEIWVKD